MDLQLEGKTAIITGASQGMGRAIAKQLAAEGVKIFATARNIEMLTNLANEISEAGRREPIIFSQDITSESAPQLIVQQAMANLGHIDILINNAGRTRPLDVNGPDEEWHDALTLDFHRHRQLTQHLLHHFMERRKGAILNITSTYELRAINASAVAKASMVVWSKQLAGQLGKHGVRINCLQPGLIDTANIRPLFPGDERKKFAEREIPLGDFGQPEDIADMATFLVSPRARYITGSVIAVDGGIRYHPF